MPKIKPELIKCARCGKQSEQYVIYSRSSFGSMDLDTRPPMSEMTLQFEAQECPHCHYCGSTIADAENAPKDFSSEYSALADDGAVLQTAKKFLLTAMLRADRGDNFGAGINYLKAAWIYDDSENNGDKADNSGAVKAREKAAVYLRKYADESGNGEIAIMVVDVLRRAGQFAAASEMISLIGDAGYDFFNNIIGFEKSLIESGDSSRHNMEEVPE